MVNHQIFEQFKFQNDMIQQLLAEKKSAKGKGKGKGKRSESVPTVSPQDIPATTSSGGLFGSLRSAFSGGQQPTSDDQLEDDAESISSAASSIVVVPEEGTSTSTAQGRRPTPARRQVKLNLGGGATSTIWLTKLQLELNGQPVDQFNTDQTEEQAMGDFNRLYMTCGLTNALNSNNIRYDAFLGGTFISAWDLSTTGSVSNSYALPNTKTGILIWILLIIL